MPKEYAAEFRRRAVALARSRRPVGQLAADLKVSEATLFRAPPGWPGRELDARGAGQTEILSTAAFLGAIAVI
jgi:transposase-like protein